MTNKERMERLKRRQAKRDAMNPRRRAALSRQGRLRATRKSKDLPDVTVTAKRKSNFKPDLIPMEPLKKQTFGEAFAAARKAGKKTFKFTGKDGKTRSYTTETREEKAKRESDAKKKATLQKTVSKGQPSRIKSKATSPRAKMVEKTLKAKQKSKTINKPKARSVTTKKIEDYRKSVTKDYSKLSDAELKKEFDSLHLKSFPKAQLQYEGLAKEFRRIKGEKKKGGSLGRGMGAALRGGGKVMK